MVTNCLKMISCLLTVTGMNLLGNAGYCQTDTLRARDFSICFGGTTVANNSGGGVILTRTSSGVDAGCEFHLNGGNIPLDSLHSRIELQPERSINNGYYVVTITFRNNAGRWDEKDWIPDTEQRDTRVQVLADVRKFASANGIIGMTEYFIKIRVQPWKFEGGRPAFVFRRLSVMPVSMNLMSTPEYSKPDTLRARDFSVCFGGTTVANNSGGVILTRTSSGVDAGCEFHPNGGNIPLDAAHSRIELQPERSINNGYYVVTITFRNNAGRWDEKNWIPDTEQRDTRVQVLADVRKFASANGIIGMTEYFIKIRVQPWRFEGARPAFVFRRLSVMPVR